MSIESNQFIATPAAIEKLVGEILDAEQTSTSARGIFLKSVVATTQAELGSPPRMRNVRADRLSETDIMAHLKAFEEVAKRFHAAVLKVAEATVPEPDAALLRSRTGFARSALSTVRGFIRSGNDIRAVAAHKATKAALAAPRTKRKFSVEALKRRATTLAGELERVAKNLHAANREIAAEALRPVLAALMAATGATEHMTRDQDKAISEGLPFHTKTGVFVPIDFATARRKAA